MGKTVTQALSVMTDKNAEFWGVAQINLTTSRTKQKYFNQLINQRLDNINLCFNKRFIFKSPGLIEELDNE